MDWRDHATFVIGGVANILGEARLTIAVTLALLIFLLLLWIAVARRAPRKDNPPIAVMPKAAPSPAVPARSDVLTPQQNPETHGTDFTLEGVALGKARTILPKNPRAFLLLVLVLMVGCWGHGLAITPDRGRFLASPEWRFQPFYIAAHLITLRMIISVYTRNFTAGLARLDVDAEHGIAGLRYILGPFGRLAALAIAAPFCFLDYQYLASPRYEKLSGSESVSAADLLMWAIWSIEWIINAFLWVVLVGYSMKNCWILSRYPFRAPVDAVLHERHYRPFLQMSSQGSTVLLGFSLITVFYITYTGGALSDYLGLGITCALLVLGFVVPWSMLKAKIRKSVLAETVRLQRAVTQGRHHPHATHEPTATVDLKVIEQRLSEAVAMLRITHLDRIHLNLGRTEAKAIMLRLLAPAATIGWQVFQNASETILKLERFLQWLSLGLKRLAG